MDLGTLMIALPVFFVLYQGFGLLAESRATPKWVPPGEVKPSASSQKTLRELSGWVGKLSFNKLLLRSKLSERLDLLLIRSGHPFGWKIEDLLFVKEITAILMVLFFSQADTGSIGMLVIAGGIGFWLPDVYLKAKGTARQVDIQRRLPGFVDLLALMMESGLDMLAAAERILEKMRDSSLREELYTLLQESRLGTPRKEALQNLGFRVNLPDLHSLISIIIQSEELGTGLVSTLRNYSEDMRNRRILRAEEAAGKAPVKLLFPMMIFFFPIVFVIIFGPIALSFISGYK